jgi:hypothetical protein
MDMTKLWTRSVAAMIVVSSALVIAPGAHAAPGLPADLLAQHGFGDRQNSYAWSMAWFKGKLYVGTGRNVLCVEGATSQFYFKFTNLYQTNPALDVHCPPNQYDLDLRAEIWQYTPQTGKWRMVYRSPADIPNPRARGKFLARDTAYRGMKVVRDRHGREALFISGVTSDEYVPEIARSHPPRLLRTYDGRHFHDISVPTIVRRTGTLVDRRPVGYRGLEVWRKRLYVVASASLTGDGAIFEVRNPFARKARFSQVSPTDMAVFEMQRFDGDLYVGTGSFDHGYGVYKTDSKRAPFRFKPVVTDGAGLGQKMVSVVSMYPYRGHLYVGGVSWLASNQLPESELIRIGRGDQWELVTGNPRVAPDGQWRYPISGLPAGFGNAFNAHLWRIVDKDGALYVGTLDWSWQLQETSVWAGKWAWLANAILKGQYGFDVWSSCDGVNWSAVTLNAFNGDPDDFGVRSLVAAPRGFYIGSANHAHGTTIWHERLSACGSPGGASRARVAQAPRQLLTDVQRDGTVLSWVPAAGAVKYRVERAEYVDAPLSVERPSGARGAFPPEDAQPQAVPPGTPGSLEVQVPVSKPFTTLGTTSRSYFVDRTRKPGVRYAYRVVAETGAGETALTSNIQVVPDPRPPATFGQLKSAAHRSPVVATIAQAHRHGDKRSLARLARLARTARDDRVRELAYRLERRLRYENFAERPVRGG